jgi:hypothetical protein
MRDSLFEKTCALVLLHNQTMPSGKRARQSWLGGTADYSWVGPPQPVEAAQRGGSIGAGQDGLSQARRGGARLQSRRHWRRWSWWHGRPRNPPSNRVAGPPRRSEEPVEWNQRQLGKVVGSWAGLGGGRRPRTKTRMEREDEDVLEGGPH